MDSRDSGNLWTRRSNSNNKLSLATHDRDGKNDGPTRTFSSSKRYTGGEGSSHGGRSNPFNTVTPISTAAVASPTSNASSAFALGTGAFASFGSANKTPKTPGTAFDLSKTGSGAPTPPPPTDKKEKEKLAGKPTANPRLAGMSSATDESTSDHSSLEAAVYPLKYTWVIWFRPPTSKNADYEKSIQAMAKISTVYDFWTVYTHCKRPSALPSVSEYHFFKEGIRPIWEDEENRKGGKWTMRLKKGVADRYWENLLMAMVGDQFYEAGEEVCGTVLSVRSGEDVFSIWTRNDGGRNVKIRETVKRVLELPADTNIQWKSHDDSLAQRTAIDQARQERAGHHATDKRRGTLSGDNHAAGKDKS